MKLIQWDIDNYNTKDSTGRKMLLARVSNKFQRIFNGFWDQDNIRFEMHIDEEILFL